jgi:hypothetical protein
MDIGGDRVDLFMDAMQPLREGGVLIRRMVDRLPGKAGNRRRIELLRQGINPPLAEIFRQPAACRRPGGCCPQGFPLPVQIVQFHQGDSEGLAVGDPCPDPVRRILALAVVALEGSHETVQIKAEELDRRPDC